ncbi:methyltransferase domain-containing protein [Sphingomonas sp. MAH-20]|uniref:Methyltransferase domain-containing protein n=1 Tax=Sphingomonas horti TaxID=2682842 RepID=A0A6I4J3G9_9SPHN|nr:MULTISPECIES: methyltransferase domain-containing protein [Sphingomonas]MBA2918942.1 methyltransferase domain-containing protein [Sphingomonas sp. CGMCC 1.13658]MVO78975.1 methyltransferase domain-containing protein [Sphingomonas horti]
MSVSSAGEKAGALPRRRPSHPLALFFKGFLKHPAMVGSVIPSSRALVDKMLAPVDWERVKLFVEYGPGVGTYTAPILDRLGPDATLIAIDTNPDFVTFLRREMADPRLHAVRGSAADVRRIVADFGFDQADYVLSGLPFSTLPEGVGDRIAAETAAVLKADGAFLVYQVSAKVADYIGPHFPAIERGFEWLNIPPMRLFWARKG